MTAEYPGYEDVCLAVALDRPGGAVPVCGLLKGHAGQHDNRHGVTWPVSTQAMYFGKPVCGRLSDDGEYGCVAPVDHDDGDHNMIKLPQMMTDSEWAAKRAAAPDPVDHPAHYTAHPSGVECITVTEHMNFCRGNAVKYIWRAGEKGSELEDLRKARWYLDREIARLEGSP